MSKTLRKRVQALEKGVFDSRIYVLKWQSCFAVGYWTKTVTEQERDCADCNGPFATVKEAHEWRLRDLQTNFSKAFERYLKKHSSEDIDHCKYLVVDKVPEFIDSMLDSNADPAAFTETELSMRGNYQEEAEELRALSKELSAR